MRFLRANHKQYQTKFGRSMLNLKKYLAGWPSYPAACASMGLHHRLASRSFARMAYSSRAIQNLVTIFCVIGL